MDKTQREAATCSDTHQYVRAIIPGTAVHTILAVGEATRKDARNGPFWMLDLKDATGTLAARVWSPLAMRFEAIPTGSLVEVEGRAERYREQLQLSVSNLRILDSEETAAMDTSAFMPASARSPLLMVEELELLADNVLTHTPWRDFMRLVLQDNDIRSRLLKAPAARGIHHARVGGLLEHTLGVVRLCLHFAELYPQLDRQALFVGAVCHDLGKLWELTSGLSIDYTDEGRLAGHIFLGIGKLMPLAEAAHLGPDLILHLQHLILSHHGQYEFGSPRLPQTAEAFALHYADNMDAKMDQCRNLFTDMEPEESAWSPFQKTLERAVFRAPRTPEGGLLADEPVAEEPFEELPTVGDLLGEEPADEEPAYDGPQDDIPDDDFSQNDFLQDNFSQNDFSQNHVPEIDIPEDIPADFVEAFAEECILDEQAATGDDCVFEHITDTGTINDTVAMAEASNFEASEPEFLEIIDADEHVEPQNEPETLAPKSQTTEAQPVAPQPRQEKTRLEVRQCSLL